MRHLLAPLIALALASAAHAQVISNPGTVTTTGTITAGDCAKFSASTVIQDAGAACGGSGGSPGGSNTQIQYNNSGSFGGASGLTTDGTSLTLTSGTQTANYKSLNITQTWNNSGTVFDAPLFMNVTNTASATGSFLADLQVGGSSVFVVTKLGDISARSLGSYNGSWQVTSGGSLTLGSNNSTISLGASNDTTLSRQAAANWHLGFPDAATPVAQTLGVQGVVAGTSNTAGALWIQSDSAGTGSAASGGFEWDVHPAGSSGTAQNAAAAAFTISGAGLAALPKISSDATHTDATLCEDTTTHGIYYGSGTLGICLGTSSARYKHDIAPLDVGLDEIMRIQTVRYYYNADHGDPNKLQYGVTAEQLQTVLPTLVSLDKDGKPNTADLVGMIPILLHAMQQQQAEIAALKAQIASPGATFTTASTVH